MTFGHYGWVDLEWQRRWREMMMGKVAAQESQTVNAQEQEYALDHIRCLFESRGFAIGKRIAARALGERCLVVGEIEFTQLPPCTQMNTYYSLLGDGGVMVRGPTLGQSRFFRHAIQDGQVQQLVSLDVARVQLDAARVMRMWLDCEPSIDGPRFPPIQWDA
jgi:hypothetical protein